MSNRDFCWLLLRPPLLWDVLKLLGLVAFMVFMIALAVLGHCLGG